MEGLQDHTVLASLLLRPAHIPSALLQSIQIFIHRSKLEFKPQKIKIIHHDFKLCVLGNFK